MSEVSMANSTPLSLRAAQSKKIHHVVIVGGGFAGLNAAKSLANKSDIKVTIIDRRNYHLFQPLLYQVATAGLSPADIAVPIRSVLANANNIDVRLGNVTTVNINNKSITADEQTFHYDFLVLACGAKHSYFGHNEWEDLAPGLKTLEQATEIRRRILLAFELAEKEENPQKKKELLTFVIVGGGPTGVELAGAISEISRYTLERDFRHIDPSSTRVLLIESGPRILASFTEHLSKKAARDLETMGVQIWTSTQVTNITINGVEMGSEALRAATVLWAAGVKPSSLGKTLGVPLDLQGRVIVERDLTIKNHPDVFVLGDQAHFQIGTQITNQTILPGLAPVAMQQGRHAAKNILKAVNGKPKADFVYRDKGQMATIGRRKAVMQTNSMEMAGLFAWLAWLFVHIYYLISFKNRFFVFYQWAWSYLTFRRGARLIISKEWHSTQR